jgi:predicted ArsR family transcriptional regulator
VTDEDLLGVIRESDAPTVNAREVADEVALSRRCVHSRLMDLTEEGVLATKSMANGARIWWLSEN